MKPFDLEVWYGERVAVLGSNGSGKSHFLRLLAAGRQRPGRRAPPGRRHARSRRWRTPAGPGSARGCGPGWFAQTHEHPELVGRTLLDILWRGDEHRVGHGPGGGVAGAGPLRAGARRGADASSRCRAASRRGCRSCCWSSPGATLLLLDEPTDNLDLVSAEALEEGLAAFDGTVVAVTHDRWFARGFDRFLVFGADGAVYESDEPVWDEGRVQRAR